MKNNDKQKNEQMKSKNQTKIKKQKIKICKKLKMRKLKKGDEREPELWWGPNQEKVGARMVGGPTFRACGHNSTKRHPERNLRLGEENKRATFLGGPAEGWSSGGKK